MFAVYQTLQAPTYSSVNGFGVPDRPSLSRGATENEEPVVVGSAETPGMENWWRSSNRTLFLFVYLS
jgi:hypothetical protein